MYTMSTHGILIALMLITTEFVFFSIGSPMKIPKDSVDIDSQDMLDEFASELSSKRFEDLPEQAFLEEAMDFPEENKNYDYEFSDVGDLFDYIPEEKEAHSPVKRYSDATVTDMRSRLERLKLLKVKQKFIQYLMGKRASDDAFPSFMSIFRGRTRHGKEYYDNIMDEYQREFGSDLKDANLGLEQFRQKRSSEMIYADELAKRYRLRLASRFESWKRALRNGGYKRSGADDFPVGFPEALKIKLMRRN